MPLEYNNPQNVNQLESPLFLLVRVQESNYETAMALFEKKLGEITYDYLKQNIEYQPAGGFQVVHHDNFYKIAVLLWKVSYGIPSVNPAHL